MQATFHYSYNDYTSVPIQQRRLRVQGHRVSRSTATRSQIKEADILSPFSFASPRPVSNRFARCRQAALSFSGYSQVYRSRRVARLGFAYCRDSMTIVILRFQFFFSHFSLEIIFTMGMNIIKVINHVLSPIDIIAVREAAY